MRDSRRLRKRFFLNLDGTGQAEFSRKASVGVDGTKTSPAVSNVARIGRATLLEDEQNDLEQIVYYQSGLAARAETSYTQLFYDGGLGSGLVSNVREAYGFLCNNYDFGDEIFITGFSRGAFTARSVAGLIGRIGILTKRGLEMFYEAFEYYEDYKTFEKAKKPCPVSEAAGTTRFNIPSTGQRITIKAVGVWDTVGALRGDYGFHDVAIGDHIEHGFHVLSLDEKRDYYEPTLWETPNESRSLQKFEQCWLCGDHSNIGGSWDDQQMADIALAWMMSRFEELGVKFDQNYLYREYLKFNKFVKEKGPGLRGGTSGGDEGPAYPKDPGMNPRTWAEGRIRNMDASSVKGWLTSGGEEIRTPAGYHRPKEHEAGYFKRAFVDSDGGILQNTNETFHATIRIRRFSPNVKKLGAHDAGPFDPKSMSGWTWPCAQPDGRVGESRKGKLEYSATIEGKKVVVTESQMGRHEKIYLAFYDQDPVLQKRDGSLWKKVFGGDGPPPDIKDLVDRLRKGEDVNNLQIQSNAQAAGLQASPS